MKAKLKTFCLATLYSPYWCMWENMTSDLKMATVQEKGMWTLRFFETTSVIKMQRRYETQYGKDPPSEKAIRLWLKQCQRNWQCSAPKGSRKTDTSQEDVDLIQEAYVQWKADMLKLFSALQYWFYN
jgi:hypothetical protein